MIKRTMVKTIDIYNWKIYHTFSCTILSDKSVGMNLLGAGRCIFSSGAESTHPCKIQAFKDYQVPSFHPVQISSITVHKSTDLNCRASDFFKGICSSIPWLYLIRKPFKFFRLPKDSAREWVSLNLIITNSPTNTNSQTP